MLVVRSLDPATRQLATWFCEPVGHHYYSGEHIDCWQPMAMSERALENAHSVAARVATEPVSYTHLTLPTIYSV